jgi:hypothetical protein
MTAKKIETLLKKAFLKEGSMAYSLYQYELEEAIDDFKASMQEDQDDYLFAVTENTGHVAAVLIEKSGGIYINEAVRERLKTLWLDNYERNLKDLIPGFADQLHSGELVMYGVRVQG